MLMLCSRWSNVDSNSVMWISIDLGTIITMSAGVSSCTALTIRSASGLRAILDLLFQPFDELGEDQLDLTRLERGGVDAAQARPEPLQLHDALGRHVSL